MTDCIVLTVESSEDKQSPSATVCLFKQVSWLSLWQADEQKRPIFLQGHAFRPLSQTHKLAGFALTYSCIINKRSF